MHVPTREDLGRYDGRVLDAYLAHGLGIGEILSQIKKEKSSSGDYFDFELGSLPILDKKQFVLTLDFAMEMLRMNECIECHVPCIVEGETGVSKTAITRMLFLLKNHSNVYRITFKVRLFSLRQLLNQESPNPGPKI